MYDFGEYQPGNAASIAREVHLYEGHVRNQASDTEPETINFEDLMVVGPGSRAGFTLHEGDRGTTGDRADYTTTSHPTAQQIPNVLGENDNIAVSQSEGGQSFTDFTGDLFFNGSTDVRNVDLAELDTGDTEMDLTLDTTGDGYLLQNATLAAPASRVIIDKTSADGSDQQTVGPGESPEFTITVTNAGSTDLTDVEVTDDQAPDCARNVGALPAAPAEGSSVTYACTGEATDASFTNTATVEALPPASPGDTQVPLNDADTSRVEVPRVRISKSTPTPIVAAGDPVSFDITVTNIGSVPLTDLSVSDPLVADCERDPLDVGAALEPDASVASTCTDNAVPEGYTNTARVDASGDGRLVSDTDTAAVRVSDLTITKTPAAPDVPAGTSGDYTITVTNSGEVPLTDVTVSDPVAADCERAIGDLQPGEENAVEYTCTSGELGERQDNTATATGHAPSGPPVQGVAQATIAVSGIMITKTAAPVSAAPGGDVEFTIEVTNTGEVPLSDVTVEDDQYPDCARDADDLPALTTIEPADTARYTCTVAAGDADITNTATASGTAPSGDVLADDDNAVVHVTPPDIEVHKTVDRPVVRAGETVTFTVQVVNVGDVDLTDVEVTDANAPGCDFTIASLPVDGTKEVTCDVEVTESIINTAEASGTPTGGGTSVQDQDTAEVRTADLEVIKETSTPVVREGDEATFTVTVRNTGGVDLFDVGLEDEAVADCARTIGRLDAGAEESWTCTAEDVTESFQNSATASGATADGVDVEASDEADVAITGITLEKAADPTEAAAGQPVAYTFTITNTGDVPLQAVEVRDAQLPDCSRVGGQDLGTLQPGTSTDYTCDATMADQDVHNTAVASGAPPSGLHPDATDDATVSLQQPSIKITKSTDPEPIPYDGTATFTITVHNTGPLPLSDVEVSDPQVPSCNRTIGTLAPDQQVNFPCDDPNVTVGYTNTATVKALDRTMPAL